MEIINLDMVPGKKSPVCHASQYDDGRVIRFKLYDSGLPFTLDGTETITFEVRKPDGNIVTSTLTNTSDSYVDVVTTEQMTAVKGANLCEVRVEKGATNIGSLNVIMAVEMDPTDGGIASTSVIDNLRSQISGMVAEEVAGQYDAGNVIFDSAPTPGHGNGYAVTSEGVNNALAPKADRSELPDMTNYYDKTETDDLLDEKADASDLPDMSNYYTKTETDTALAGKNATNIPISSSNPTNTKDYIDNSINAPIKSSEVVSIPNGDLAVGSNWSEGCSYVKRNGLIILHLALQGLTANTRNDIYTLPTSCRPSSQIVGAGMGGNSYTAFAQATITPGGVIQVSSVDTYARIHLMYYVNE